MENQINVFVPVLQDMFSLFCLFVLNYCVIWFYETTHRGFFCDDESIKYPFHDSTVPSVWNHIILTLTSIIVIVFCEWKNSWNEKSLYYNVGKIKIKAFYWNTYKWLLCYFSGVKIRDLITLVGKKTIGRLRPHFLDVCKPNVLCIPNYYEYIQNYTCVNSNSKLVDEGRLSFPSGHSSYSFYVAIFLVLYIEKKLKINARLFKGVIQLVVISYAWFVALSRVMDYHHHWSDVLAGMIIGSGTAILNTVVVFGLFEDGKNQNTKSNTGENVMVNVNSSAERVQS